MSRAVAAETDGEAFLLSSDSAEIIETVLEAIGSATEKADVKLVPVGDYFELIQSISPKTAIRTWFAEKLSIFRLL